MWRELVASGIGGMGAIHDKRFSDPGKPVSRYAKSQAATRIRIPRRRYPPLNPHARRNP
jgi:hypothetical protein